MKEDYTKLYRRIHKGYKCFSGFTGCRYADNIKALVEKTNSKSLLDYGSGKGFQYLLKRVHEQWGGILPHCYDPGVVPISDRPKGTFHGVICTDVMEHIHEEDVPEILADVFSFAEKFVFLSICTRESGKLLPDGRGVHLTVMPKAWWRRHIAELKRPGLIVEAEFSESDDEEAQTAEETLPGSQGSGAATVPSEADPQKV